MRKKDCLNHSTRSPIRLFFAAQPHTYNAIPSMHVSRHLRQIAATSRCRGHRNKHASCSNSNSLPHKHPEVAQIPPPPSWSTVELRLSSHTDEIDKISNQELAILSRRCLIDVRRLSLESRDRLRIHVAAIMRCASVLCNANRLGSNNENIYDAPRGLSRVPVRRDISEDGKDR